MNAVIVHATVARTARGMLEACTLQDSVLQHLLDVPCPHSAWEQVSSRQNAACDCVLACHVANMLAQVADTTVLVMQVCVGA